ncbi:hypothetical protein DID78_02365, partial [Candidatus Marinamargulisbacteria bacterium SCGC AG-343-D04]
MWGGAVGFLSYEASRYLVDFEHLTNDQEMPDCYFGFY